MSPAKQVGSCPLCVKKYPVNVRSVDQFSWAQRNGGIAPIGAPREPIENEYAMDVSAELVAQDRGIEFCSVTSPRSMNLMTLTLTVNRPRYPIASHGLQCFFEPILYRVAT